MTELEAQSRTARRKAQTRAALVAAARELSRTRELEDVSIQEITDTADVGFGSFYNHFRSKQDLLEAAVDEVVEEHGRMLDQLTTGIADPAEVFAISVRMTARLPRTHPELAQVLARRGAHYFTGTSEVTPRIGRDLQRAKDAGRFSFGDPVLALACFGGAVLSALELILTRDGEGDVDRAADDVTLYLLRMFGLPEDDARALVGRPLPTP